MKSYAQLVTSVICAHGSAAHSHFTFEPTLVDAGMQLSAAPATDASPSTTAPREPFLTALVAAPPRFGAEGSSRWQLLGGYANDFDAAQQGQFGASVSWFAIDDLSIDVQIDGDVISQPGGTAWGIGGSLLFRWHFIAAETWSLYADAGSGLLATTQPTPEGGTSFNFTPQAGGGVSFEVAADVRLMVGARWYHISNANTGAGNPGRNSLMGYVMISFPF